MQKYIAIFILLIIGIIGYNFYSYEKEKEEREKAVRNKPKVVDFKKDFNSIFFDSEKEPEKQKSKEKVKEIKTLMPRKRTSGSRTLTNKDIERLNRENINNRKMITKEDIQKLKGKDPDNFKEKVKIEKIKKEKPEKKLSPLEKIINSAKKSFSEKNDDDAEK